MDKIERQLNLVAFLLTQRMPVDKHILLNRVDGYRDSGEHDSVERRFERDKTDLATLGIPLLFTEDGAGNAGYVIQRESVLLPSVSLSASERVLLEAVARAYLNKHEHGVIGDALTTALLKLKFDLDGDADPRNVDGADDDTVAVLPIRRQLERKGEAATLDALLDAVAQRRSVKFSYTKTAGDAEPRRVQPFALLFVNGFWYLHGHDLDRDARRTFKLVRMAGKVAPADAKAPAPQYAIPGELDLAAVERAVALSPELVGEGELRAADGDAAAGPIDVVFRADRDIAFMIAEQFESAPNAHAELLDDGALRLTITTTPGPGLFRFFLTWLPHLTIESPATLRDAYRENLQAIRTRY